MGSESLTQDSVKRLLIYRDGELYWRKPGSRRNMSKPAGYLMPIGYRRIESKEFGGPSKSYLTHRLVFLYHHGYLPKYIDHTDGNPLNNHIDNLRECSQHENTFNSGSKLNGTSKYKGVYWNKNLQKWHAQIKIKGSNQEHLGYFNCEKEAASAYNKRALELHGKFVRLNSL